MLSCPHCYVTLVADADTEAPREESALKLRLSPILREALADVKPGEDFDEAVLRTLKARHPEQATALLSAVTRIIEIEVKRANEDRQQIIRRLAESDPGPEIVLRSSGGESPRTVAETRVIRIGDKEYGSLDEVPPHLRRIIKSGGRRRNAQRVGCSWALVGGWLAALSRMLGE